MSRNERQPLIRESHETAQGDHHGTAIECSYDHLTRRETQRFLSSKYGHYAILLLVSLDVTCIFADFLISLYVCDHKCEKGESVGKGFRKTQEVLGIVSLVFSSLFMVELVASIWAFGFSYEL